jgi:hypothetical protein
MASLRNLQTTCGWTRPHLYEFKRALVHSLHLRVVAKSGITGQAILLLPDHYAVRSSPGNDYQDVASYRAQGK